MSGDPREPQDQSQTILMLTITVLCLLFVSLAYVTHEHPTLMGPLTVATGGVTLVLAMLLYARRRPRPLAGRSARHQVGRPVMTCVAAHQSSSAVTLWPPTGKADDSSC
jgi:hypothetical protein